MFLQNFYFNCVNFTRIFIILNIINLIFIILIFLFVRKLKKKNLY